MLAPATGRVVVLGGARQVAVVGAAGETTPTLALAAYCIATAILFHMDGSLGGPDVTDAAVRAGE